MAEIDLKFMKATRKQAKSFGNYYPPHKKTKTENAAKKTTKRSKKAR